MRASLHLGMKANSRVTTKLTSSSPTLWVFKSLKPLSVILEQFREDLSSTNFTQTLGREVLFVRVRSGAGTAGASGYY